MDEELLNDAKTILIVDDEAPIRDILVYNLEKEGYKTIEASDGITAVDIALEKKPDLILLDVMLPKLDGLSVCKRIKNSLNVPILMLTAKDNEVDKIVGLELGADDYITKPFSLMILRARIRALLRRNPIKNEPEYKDSIFLFRFETMEFYKNGISIELSKTEQRILYLLTSNPNIIITRERLLEWVWPEGTEYVEDNALSVAIRRLRDKLEDDSSNPQYIKTVYGKGYMWENL